MPSLTSTQQRCHHGGHATRVLPALAQSCGFAAESPGVAVLMRQRWAVDCSAPGHPCNTQGGMSDLISNHLISSTIQVRLKPHRRHISRCVLALHPWMRPLLLPPSMDIYICACVLAQLNFSTQPINPHSMAPASTPHASPCYLFVTEGMHLGKL